MTNEEKSTLVAKISVAFRPSAPIDRYSLFAGRGKESDSIINAVFQAGQHAILYGERGVGKTSLAKVLAELLSKAGMKTVHSDTINCDASDTFSSLWHKALRELSFKIKTTSVHFSNDSVETEHNLDSLVPATVTPDDVRRALSTVTKRVIIVFDEFDRVQDKDTKTLMADTIKNLSDHSVNTTLLLVGVAQSVIDLIAEHRSVERALIEVHMPRMSKEELGEIILKGLSETTVTMAESVKDKIVRLSHGLPHYTHLLALESGLSAVDRGSKHIEDDDFAAAVNRIVNSKQTVAQSYYSAVLSAHKSSKHKLTLLSCALTPIDGYGFFQASDVAHTMSTLLHKECSVSDIQKHLTEFTSERRGTTLERQGTTRRYRYRFSNPLLQPYVIIHSLSEKLISESQLWMMDQPFK
jgi:Cdc6-like AAA superfamily ATPase